ncbi:Arp10p Ecym_3505 [Eremothecium cymbalariae DBVPG|uniref:Actin-related protein n=1 Tax=Eremothecium cymbalariae (strain CBS 270.75 / DBVPG 7215 / KCTC 17166 / NRRL Y-17582) TaxID=931890 RepID=G8JS64_ERECY|nr:Hypothetical protein Ecym_3505 [Eremothecium cymbalariae DBVPG\
MEVPVVIQLGNKFCVCGRAGDIDPIDMRQIPADWLEDELAVFDLMRFWIHDTIMCMPNRLKIVILENVLLDVPKKKRLCHVLLDRLMVSSVVFLPDILMACVAGGVTDAIVVDIGWENTVVAPIMDMRILEQHMGISKIGAKWIGSKLSSTFEIDGEKIVRMIKLDTDINCNGVQIEWRDIEDCMEILWNINKQDPECDIDEFPIISLVLESIKQLPIDVKSKVLQNVIIIGGLSKIQGLKERLIENLRYAHTNARGINILKVWQGGSIYTYHSLMHNDLDQMEVNREEFKSSGIVPDWQLQRFM